MHPVLVETAPWSPFRVGLEMLAFAELGILAVFGTLAVVVGIAEGDFQETLQYILFIMLFGLTVAIPYSVANALAYRNGRPTLRVLEGEVQVRYGDIAVERHPLSDCQWYIGKSMMLGKIVVPRQEAILLVPPSNTSGAPMDESEAQIPCGCNEESRERWESFLTLANTPRRTLWERRRSLVAQAAVIGGGITLVIAGFFGMGTLWRHAENQLIAQGVARDVAEAISQPIFMPGFVYVILYVVTFYPWQMLPRVPSRKSKENQRAIRLRATLGFAGVGLFVAVTTAMGQKAWGSEARLWAIVETLLLTVVFAFDYGRRIARTELATTSESLEKRD